MFCVASYRERTGPEKTKDKHLYRHWALGYQVIPAKAQQEQKCSIKLNDRNTLNIVTVSAGTDALNTPIVHVVFQEGQKEALNDIGKFYFASKTVYHLLSVNCQRTSDMLSKLLILEHWL